jgi:hypothetical protein
VKRDIATQFRLGTIDQLWSLEAMAGADLITPDPFPHVLFIQASLS